MEGTDLLLERKDLELELALNLSMLGLDTLEALDSLSDSGRDGLGVVGGQEREEVGVLQGTGKAWE